MIVDGMFGKPNPKANAEDGADCASTLPSQLILQERRTGCLGPVGAVWFSAL